MLPVVEGADPDALAKGVGHVTNSVYPGQNDQIILSGHRDTVFRQFDKIEIGDHYKITTPYGTYTYELKRLKLFQLMIRPTSGKRKKKFLSSQRAIRLSMSEMHRIFL
ncbi:sortase [Virgibacillus natechei]|uniref:sortase n=1 Tax=Virgibacillus sp. CBA3643 TaxID=2942278 RepID=UPI0035A3C309